MKSKLALLFAFLFLLSEVIGQVGRLPLSPVQKIEQNIGVTDIILEFSRPSMRGREIFGSLVPFNKLWRTGANRNTTIQFSEDVMIDGKRVEKGKYAIFSKPSKERWEIIFYQDTDNWDIPEAFDSSKIVANITVDSKRTDDIHEVFTIFIGDFTNYTFNLDIYWSDTFVSVPIGLTTKELMDEKINNVLSGPDYGDYYLAAVYQMESGGEYAKGVEWINRAMEVTDEVTWWDLRVKAILLMELGEYDEAEKLARKGLMEATLEKREYGINQFNIILNKLNK